MYVIDTSALLDGWVRNYPPDVFPSLWLHLEEMVKGQELLAPDEVLSELSQKDDDVHKWAKVNSAMFVPLDQDIQSSTQEILIQFPRLVGAMNDRNRADPFVIALAKIKNAVAVTGEKIAERGIAHGFRTSATTSGLVAALCCS